MKRWLAAAFIAVAACMAVIGAAAEPGAVNELQQTTQEELREKAGIRMQPPEGAQMISYFLMPVEGGASLGEMLFLWEGVPCAYRVQPTKELMDISGVNAVFEHTEQVSVAGYEGILQTETNAEDASGAGVVLWYEEKTARTHSLSMLKEASAEDLLALAQLM